MHIPDGYLSPSSCAALVALAVPFWRRAARRVEGALSTRAVPRIAGVAAFSFVVMMFNLPLPGGTTGHAVGIGIATRVAGPWAAMLAISVALFIQALLFGDGGVLSFGANAFNMAIVGALVMEAALRLLGGRRPGEPRRQVLAGMAGGYLAVNAGALLVALELGLQPLLFHDAAGAPLYAPYPLHIALPAMLIGHLTWAGLAEAVLTGGVVGYLLRTEPGLLDARPAAAASPFAWRRAAALLALFLLLTPLGLLAGGAAWGEWRPEEFGDPAARARIAEASLGHPPPESAPSGLLRLAGVWSAPLPGYAPAFLRSAALGYFLSACFGSGLVLGAVLAVGQLAAIRRARTASP